MHIDIEVTDDAQHITLNFTDAPPLNPVTAGQVDQTTLQLVNIWRLFEQLVLVASDVLERAPDEAAGRLKELNARFMRYQQVELRSVTYIPSQMPGNPSHPNKEAQHNIEQEFGQIRREINQVFNAIRLLPVEAQQTAVQEFLGLIRHFGTARGS